MELLAKYFDHPYDSREHRDLESTAFMGGPLVSVRYLLGRLLHRNLFRESNEAVSIALFEFLSKYGDANGAQLAFDTNAWSSIAVLLRHEFEIANKIDLTSSKKLFTALHAVIMNPELALSEIAIVAETTEKQVERMSDVKWLKELWRRRRTVSDK